MFLEKQKNAFILYQGIRWPTNYCNMERDSPQRGGGIATASAAAAARGAATRGCAVAAAAPRREAEPFAPDDEEFLMVPSFPPARAPAPSDALGAPPRVESSGPGSEASRLDPQTDWVLRARRRGWWGRGGCLASGRSIAPPTQRQGCARGAAKCG